MENELKVRLKLIQEKTDLLKKILKDAEKICSQYDLLFAEKTSREIQELLQIAAKVFNNKSRLLRIENVMKSEFSHFKYEESSTKDFDMLKIKNNKDLLALISVDEKGEVLLNIQKIAIKEPFFVVLQNQIEEKFNVAPKSTVMKSYPQP